MMEKLKLKVSNNRDLKVSETANKHVLFEIENKKFLLTPAQARDLRYFLNKVTFDTNN